MGGSETRTERQVDILGIDILNQRAWWSHLSQRQAEQKNHSAAFCPTS